MHNYTNLRQNHTLFVIDVTSVIDYYRLGKHQQ